MNASIASMSWAILRARLEAYSDVDFDLFADAEPDIIEAMYAAREAAAHGGRKGSVAVVSVFGPISKRDTMMTQVFGGTSTNRLSAQVQRLAADKSVSHVILNVDSPGGTVSGLPELAADIRALAQVKPVTAISNDLNASAAYWLSSQATTIVATPESLTGSIGVFTAPEDLSELLAAEGVKVEFISSTPEKVEGNPFEPLSDDARDHMQALVDSAMDLFVADVSKGRGVSEATVRSDFGKGRVLDAKSAKRAGLVDRIGTFTDTVARVSGRRAEAGVTLTAEVVDTADLEADAEKARADRLLIDQDRWRFSR